MGSPNGTSRKYNRPHFVTRILQISAHLIECHSDEVANVLTTDPIGLRRSDKSQHLRPEMAVICRATLPPRRTEGLTRETPGKEIRRGRVDKGSDVAMNGHLREVLAQHLLAVRINLAVENGAEARPLRRQREAADTRKQIDVGGLHRTLL
jgi:hypothetical protein